MSVNVNIIEEVPSTILNGTFDLNTALSSIITEFSQGTFGGVLTDPSTGQQVGTWVAEGPAVPALDPTATPVVQPAPVVQGAQVVAPGAVPAGAAPLAGAPAAPVAQPGVVPAGTPVAGAVAAPAVAQTVALPCNVKVFGQDAQAPGTNRLLWSTSFSAQVANGAATIPGGLVM